jgi:hypothetical protein
MLDDDGVCCRSCFILLTHLLLPSLTEVVRLIPPDDCTPNEPRQGSLYGVAGSNRRFPPGRRLLAEGLPPLHPSWRPRIRSELADDGVMDLEAAAQAVSTCMLRIVHARAEEKEDGSPSPRASPSSFLAASIDDDDDVNDGCPRLLPRLRPRKRRAIGQAAPFLLLACKGRQRRTGGAPRVPRSTARDRRPASMNEASLTLASSIGALRPCAHTTINRKGERKLQ